MIPQSQLLSFEQANRYSKITHTFATPTPNKAIFFLCPWFFFVGVWVLETALFLLCLRFLTKKKKKEIYEPLTEIFFFRFFINFFLFLFQMFFCTSFCDRYFLFLCFFFECTCKTRPYINWAQNKTVQRGLYVFCWLLPF